MNATNTALLFVLCFKKGGSPTCEYSGVYVSSWHYCVFRGSDRLLQLIRKNLSALEYISEDVSLKRTCAGG